MSDLERYEVIYAPGKMLDTSWAAHYLIYDYFLRQADDVSTLDLCCGTGAGTKMIAERITAPVAGVDHSKEALALARFRNSGPDYFHVDLDDEDDLEALADFVDMHGVTQCFLVEGIEHLHAPEYVIGVLLSAGIERLFVSTPIEPDDARPQGFHVSPFTHARAAALVRHLESYEHRLVTLGYQESLTLPVTPKRAARAFVLEKPKQGGNYLWEILS